MLPGIAKMAWLDDEEVDFHYLCSSQVIEGKEGEEIRDLTDLPTQGAKKDAELGAPYQSQK